jgi:predicted flavoprotein YhiN
MGKEKEFGLELIKFYKSYLTGSADAIESLAIIEKKYPKEYKLVKQTKDDPSAIMQLTNELSDEAKETFLYIMIRASSLGSKLNNVFDLSQQDKEKLAKDIREFSLTVEKKITGLSKK